MLKIAWQRVAVPTVAFFQEGPGLRNWQWTDSGMKVINGTNIRDDGRFDPSNTTRAISLEEFKAKYRHFAIDANDIVVASSGTLGKAARVKAEHLPMMMNTSVIRFRANDRTRLDDGFLFAWLRSRDFLDQALGMATGAAQQNFGPSHVKQMTLPLPAIGEQRRIASILSAYDDLIENNTRRIAILEEMARRIYEEWFVRFRFPGHEGVRMVESELGLVPEGWSVKTLQDIATITMGLSPKGDTYNEDANGTPLINGPVEFGERFTKRVKWTTAPTKLCEDGDLVVCVRGSTTGKFVKSDGVYCLGRGVCAIRSKFQGFVDQVFEHQLPALLGQVGGSTFPSWTGPQLKLHPVLVPTGKLLARFEAHAGPMRDAVRAYSRQIDNLRTTRDLLLPKLISGELDVSALPEPEALAA